MNIYHDPDKGEKPRVLPCSLFGGVSPRTGKRVWSRHRWSDGAGQGHCEFCGRTRDEVLSKPIVTKGAVE